MVRLAPATFVKVQRSLLECCPAPSVTQAPPLITSHAPLGVAATVSSGRAGVSGGHGGDGVGGGA